MDSSAIQLIQDTAIQAAASNRLNTHTPAIIIGSDIKSTEHLGEGRSRFRGKLTTDSLDDFVTYTKDHPGGHGFVDAENIAAKVFFNLGETEAPGHGDWTAMLKLKPTAEYAAMLKVLGNRLSQRDMIDFAEDWSGNITAIAADGAQINVSKALAAVRKLTIKATAEATHTEKDFGARKSSLEEIEASADDGLPYGFGFTATPYAGLAIRSFTLRLSILTGGDKPQLVLRAIALESAQEAIAQEFKRKLQDGIGSDARLYLGSFTP
jgi:Uncharacterized conserved protein